METKKKQKTKEHFTHLLFSKQNGKHDEGWMILKQVHDTNMRAKGHPEKVFSVSTSEKAGKSQFQESHQNICGALDSRARFFALQEAAAARKISAWSPDIVGGGGGWLLCWDRYADDTLKPMNLSASVNMWRVGGDGGGGGGAQTGAWMN